MLQQKDQKQIERETDINIIRRKETRYGYLLPADWQVKEAIQENVKSQVKY